MIKDADIGVANSNRDAGIKEAECLKAAMDAKFETDTKIEDDTRAFKLQVAEFEKEVNTAKAQAQLAYQLEAAKLNQKIKSEEIKIDVVVRKKEIEIEEQEILRKEKELKGTVKLPAEAEAFKYVLTFYYCTFLITSRDLIFLSDTRLQFCFPFSEFNKWHKVSAHKPWLPLKPRPKESV